MAIDTNSPLPAAVPGKRIFLTNRATSQKSWTPASGEAVDGLAANAAFVLDPNESAILECFTLGVWSPVITASVKKAATVVNSNAATTDATVTAAQITGADDIVVLKMTGTLGAGGALTLPLVTDVVAALKNPVAGRSWKLRIINQSSGNFAWTVTTNTGWGTLTLVPTPAIAQNTYQDFVITLTSLTAATIEAVGYGSFH